MAAIEEDNPIRSNDQRLFHEAFLAAVKVNIQTYTQEELNILHKIPEGQFKTVNDQRVFFPPKWMGKTGTRLVIGGWTVEQIEACPLSQPMIAHRKWDALKTHLLRLEKIEAEKQK